MPDMPAANPKNAPDAEGQDELRESFFRLLRRSWVRANTRGKGLDVYLSSADLFYRLCGERWGQFTIFPNETGLVRRFLAETKLPVADRDAVVQMSLMGNSWFLIWRRILKQIDRREFNQLCTVTGIEHLRAAQATGRGTVVAHFHTVFIPMFWTWLDHEGIAPGVTIGQWAWGKKREDHRDPRQRVTWGARELHAGVQALRKGGMLHILADGLLGSQQIVVPFFNRARGFRTSFADLAVTTGSTVITLVMNLAPDGRFHMEIRPPLADDPVRDRAERVRLLVRQYAKQVHQLWLDHPADVAWPQMKLHLALPVARLRQNPGTHA